MERFAIKKMLAWKQSSRRKPLILKGVRQVGKTWIRERQKFCVHGIIGARQTGASNEHEHQTQFS